MSKQPIVQMPNGTVQLDLATYQQWQQVMTLINDANCGMTAQQVQFDTAKVEAMLTYCVGLTQPGKTAQLVTHSAKATTKLIVSPTVAGGADLLADDPSHAKQSQLSEATLRQYHLHAGDVIAVTLRADGQVDELQKVAQVTLNNDLDELSHALVEAGDELGLPGHLMVSHNQTTTLTDSSGMPYPYVIPAAVVTAFKLKVGDQVDLRWYHDELMTMQIVWRY